MNLTNRSIESEFNIKDFMIPLNECPVVHLSDLSLSSVLQSIEDGKMGFCLVVNENHVFEGLISNADVRKGMLRNLEDLNKINVIELVNKKPVFIKENETVITMLQLIKKCSFPIMYLPVLENNGKAAGIVTFVNLIKAEL